MLKEKVMELMSGDYYESQALAALTKVMNNSGDNMETMQAAGMILNHTMMKESCGRRRRV